METATALNVRSQEKIFISRYNLQGLELKKDQTIEIVPVGKVEEVFTNLFG